MRSHAFPALSVLMLLSSTAPAHALFGGVPILGEAEKWVNDKVIDPVVKNPVEAVGKGIRELANGAGDIFREGEKLVQKTFKEAGNGLEDLRVLATEGKCNGDICIAVTATAEMVEGTIKDGGQAINDAGKRLAEGKPIDALWHLSLAPWTIQQDNAAKAAMKSSVLRGVGQVAASFYGGPYGAAAYSTWLTYHATDGDVALALRAGAIAGATAYATSMLAADAKLGEVTTQVKVAEIMQRAVMSGAIAGGAIALSGGSQTDIEQAFVAGSVSSVIRDGYLAMTKAKLEDNMGHSNGDHYCLNADHESGLSCLPSDRSYIRDDAENIIYEDKRGNIVPRFTAGSKPRVDFTKLEYNRPHVGMATGALEPGGFMAEGTSAMNFVSKFPGMNGMSVAHDIFVEKTLASLPNIPGVDIVYTIGTIAPFVVMTYDGAGNTVQELIRKELAERHQYDRREKVFITPTEGVVQPESAAEPALVVGENPPAASEAVAALPATEVRQLYCVNEAKTEKNFMFESNLFDDTSSDYERVCRIDQEVGKSSWRNLWHAHYQRHFCQAKFSEMFVRYVNRGYSCYTSTGIRFSKDTGIFAEASLR